MNAKFNLKLQIANAGLVVALAATGSASAQTLPKEGSFDITSCFSGVANPIALGKTHSAYTYEMTGTTRSNPPGGMYDNLSYRCIGLNQSFDGKKAGRTICEAIDKDGDKRLTYFSADSDGTIIRDTVAGTGKYEGIVEHGAATPLGPFPVIKPGTFQDCNHQTGTYKLK